MIFINLNFLQTSPSLNVFLGRESSNFFKEELGVLILTYIYWYSFIGMGGCFGGVHQTNTESINLHVKRMRHYIDIEVQKQIKECTTLEKMLLYEFSK